METKKKEAIRRIYGSLYELIDKSMLKSAFPSEIERWRSTGRFQMYTIPELDRQQILNIELDNINGCYWHRSLVGIDHNNGWISIESDKDLPKDSYNYWLMCSDGRVINMKEYDYYKKYIIPDLIATHYQPIIKPLPPIF